METAELAQFVAETIDEIEAEYPNADLADATLTVEVRYTDEDDDPASTVQVFSLEGRNTSAVGIQVRGLKALISPDND